MKGIRGQAVAQRLECARFTGALRRRPRRRGRPRAKPPGRRRRPRARRVLQKVCNRRRQFFYSSMRACAMRRPQEFCRHDNAPRNSWEPGGPFQCCFQCWGGRSNTIHRAPAGGPEPPQRHPVPDGAGGAAPAGGGQYRLPGLRRRDSGSGPSGRAGPARCRRPGSRPRGAPATRRATRTRTAADQDQLTINAFTSLASRAVLGVLLMIGFQANATVLGGLTPGDLPRSAANLQALGQRLRAPEEIGRAHV